MLRFLSLKQFRKKQLLTPGQRSGALPPLWTVGRGGVCASSLPCAAKWQARGRQAGLQGSLSSLKGTPVSRSVLRPCGAVHKFLPLDLHPHCSFCLEPHPSTPCFHWITQPYSQLRHQILWEHPAPTSLRLASLLLPITAPTSLTPFSFRDGLHYFSVSSTGRSYFGSQELFYIASA